jgi:hypothetical protein
VIYDLALDSSLAHVRSRGRLRTRYQYRCCGHRRIEVVALPIFLVARFEVSSSPFLGIQLLPFRVAETNIVSAHDHDQHTSVFYPMQITILLSGNGPAYHYIPLSTSLNGMHAETDKCAVVPNYMTKTFPKGPPQPILNQLL